MDMEICKECGHSFLVGGLSKEMVCIHCTNPLGTKLTIRQTKFGVPNAWIQWKGTQVCMDVHCLCGESFHVDDEFTYYLHCTVCDRVYSCNPYIQLVELTTEEKPHALNSSCVDLVAEPDD